MKAATSMHHGDDDNQSLANAKTKGIRPIWNKQYK
jgi:hypothetical protein